MKRNDSSASGSVAARDLELLLRRASELLAARKPRLFKVSRPKRKTPLPAA